MHHAMFAMSPLGFAGMVVNPGAVRVSLHITCASGQTTESAPVKVGLSEELECRRTRVPDAHADESLISERGYVSCDSRRDERRYGGSRDEPPTSDNPLRMAIVQRADHQLLPPADHERAATVTYDPARSEPALIGSRHFGVVVGTFSERQFCDGCVVVLFRTAKVGTQKRESAAWAKITQADLEAMGLNSRRESRLHQTEAFEAGR